MYIPNNKNNLINIFKEIKQKKLNYFIIGKGTNILVSDEYFDGIVINLKKINNYYIKEEEITLEAGCNFQTLFYLTTKGIGGFEELACIPGSIGGLIYQNASFNNIAISDKILKVEYLDELGNVKTLDNKDLEFGYRSSIFQNNDYLILSGTFHYKKDSNINKLCEYLNHKKMNQPLNTKNAGSVFKNTNDLPAWKIIKEVHADTFKVNDASVSTKHANFLINNGNASFKDMCQLISKIKKQAKKYNYNLELEIEIIGKCLDDIEYFA